MANGNSLVHDPVMKLMGPNGLRTAIISRHARERSERVMATIVIVGEEIINHRLATLLGDHGHRVLEAADGEQALAIVRAEKPDLVLADILIGNMDGYQLVQSLRAEAGSAQPRLVFLTAAYMEADARALAQACGVSELIVKPAEPEALLVLINAALSGPPPQAGKPSLEPGSAETHFHAIVGKLYSRVAELERLNAQLEQHAAGRTEQLEVARSALEQEVTKRLWAARSVRWSWATPRPVRCGSVPKKYAGVCRTLRSNPTGGALALSPCPWASRYFPITARADRRCCRQPTPPCTGPRQRDAIASLWRRR